MRTCGTCAVNASRRGGTREEGERGGREANQRGVLQDLRVVVVGRNLHRALHDPTLNLLAPRSPNVQAVYPRLNKLLHLFE